MLSLWNATIPLFCHYHWFQWFSYSSMSGQHTLVVCLHKHILNFLTIGIEIIQPWELNMIWNCLGWCCLWVFESVLLLNYLLIGIPAHSSHAGLGMNEWMNECHCRAKAESPCAQCSVYCFLFGLGFSHNDDYDDGNDNDWHFWALIC
jgi:hypothetical protein